MTSDGGSERRDEAMPGVMRWDLGLVGQHGGGEFLWQCDALRAGRLYNRTLFGSKEAAEEFVAKMREAEPDQIFNVESIKASAVWN
jgi:hypothetical protein